MVNHTAYWVTSFSRPACGAGQVFGGAVHLLLRLGQADVALSSGGLGLGTAADG